ncbi:alpha-L-rhamnosidase C-terminal domain-containing protein [Microbacter margulisiae]|uniref:Alpha-L-rhamnosidase n=1 Tax=Microbacter margulisiae TaxID=1350067 RepID=A0A7W5DQ43_9PORP|nr:alpha-L-rhamnosidase C-terminal domain-containing protein [Microbacter margulisiae]MBB3187015.1 hypothetical protein [Microbacter margulisiae]
MKRTILLVLMSIVMQLTFAQKVATWIYYPGDFEIWLANQVQNRRTDRGTFFPPFWKMDSFYVLVEFSKKVTLAKPEDISLRVEGKYNVKIDDKFLPGFPTKIAIPAGHHLIQVKVYDQANVPAIYVNGTTIKSDSSWLVTYEDKEWIDASGRASDTSTGTVYVNAGSWNFNSPDTPPSHFKLPTTPESPVSMTKKDKGMLYDFGKETFGYVKFNGLRGKGLIHIYYGESPEEALSTHYCETLDSLPVDNRLPKNVTMTDSKAFRYIYIVKDGQLSYHSLSMNYEYLPLQQTGSFKCNDTLINKIWDVSAYTLRLTTREFFLDGIKRDRWIWSGDAYQSYLMNYYSFFNSPAVTRTIYALRGKNPVTSHINTIMDYTFYWFMSIYDYYQYTGDKFFIKQIYPRMKSMMNFCLTRRDANGMMEGLPGDWVFIDWSDFKMSKAGEVSFEQLLFCRSLEVMASCAKLENDTIHEKEYNDLEKGLRSKLFTAFWSNKANAFIQNRVNGIKSTQVTPYTNIFAVLFNYLDSTKTEDIKSGVLLNPNALQITTPYMQFYKLAALCALGEQKHVLNDIRSYWGGMLRLGATTFWEQYNPNEKGAQLLAMYGRPFGKSLCHAWGASPIYLLGKYYLGIRPTTPGYKTYAIEPHLGGLQWMEGTVPTPHGKIYVYYSHTLIKVRSDEGTGVLHFSSLLKPSCENGDIINKGHHQYEMQVQAGRSYTITCK